MGGNALLVVDITGEARARGVALRVAERKKAVDSWQRLFHMARAACRGGRYQCAKKIPGPRIRIFEI